jgi:internalin A
MTPEEQKAYDRALKDINDCLRWRGTVLRLTLEGLTRLPPEIGQLTNLRDLEITNSKLSTLPPEIGELAGLEVLKLCNNQLTTLPHEIGGIANLRSLWLQSNRLDTLPETLRSLEKLQGFYLHDNPGLQLSPSILGNDPRNTEHHFAASAKSILDYYFARREQGEAPMQEVRILLVGRGRVGKTSLLKALQGRKPDPIEQETPGITVEKLDLNCPDGHAKAHVWDFGGQEFLHGTHQIFLSERCVYVLVLEGREGNWETETDYWLRFIQSFGGDSPVMVALNKYDQHAFSVDRHRIAERCPQIAGFVETDAFSGRGVSELRGLLEAAVGRMKDVWLGVPLKWHRIRP